jgi:hypothetical protein
MSALATGERRGFVIDPPATGRSAQRLFEPRAGRVSLEDAILGAWEDLTATGSAECSVCGGRMRAAAGCQTCGSELS